MAIHDLGAFKLNYSEIDHPFLISICYVIGKISVFAAVYGDILCIIVSNRITSKLQSIINHFECKLPLKVNSNTPKSKKIAEITKLTVMTNCHSTISWQIIYNEIRSIRKLTVESSNLLSPLLLNSLMVYLFILLCLVSNSMQYLIL